MSKGYSLFVIDDDKHFLFGLHKGLKINDLCTEVYNFDDAEDALHVLETSASFPEKLPDVIFLDINMPMMDGWEFLNNLKSVLSRSAKKIRIFIVTNSVDNNDLHKAISFEEVDSFITKPLTRQKLEEIFY
jgi:two-component system chemotaxis response regulator CheY